MSVVFLHDQMRQDNDSAYVGLLDRVRDGICTEDDYKFLLTRVISEQTRHLLQQAKFANALIIVSRNELRHVINMEFLKQFAVARQLPIYMCIAQDTHKKEPVPLGRDATLRQLLDNKTSGMMGRLPLVRMMPVVLTYNIATELGLNNGTPGVLLDIVFDSATPRPINPAPGQEIELKTQPIYLLVYFPTAQLLEPLPGLPLNVVPIFPRKGRFQYKRTWYRRTQFPIIPGKAVTDYKTQGTTLDAAIANVVRPITKSKQAKQANASDASTVYVPLSRPLAAVVTC